MRPPNSSESYGSQFRRLNSLGGPGTNSAADEELGGISFIVEPPAKEVRGPTSDEGYLKSIASGNGGVYIRAGDGADRLRIDDSRKKTVTGYETKELWDSPFFLLLILGLLFSEWSLRRRWGLK